MALHLDDREVEALAAEVAAMANETETEAVRKSLLERRSRLAVDNSPEFRGLTRSERAADVLAQIWNSLPVEVRNRRLSSPEEDAILGVGRGGA